MLRTSITCYATDKRAAAEGDAKDKHMLASKRASAEAGEGKRPKACEQGMRKQGKRPTSEASAEEKKRGNAQRARLEREATRNERVKPSQGLRCNASTQEALTRL